MQTKIFLNLGNCISTTNNLCQRFIGVKFMFSSQFFRPPYRCRRILSFGKSGINSTLCRVAKPTFQQPEFHSGLFTFNHFVVNFSRRNFVLQTEVLLKSGISVFNRTSNFCSFYEILFRHHFCLPFSVVFVQQDFSDAHIFWSNFNVLVVADVFHGFLKRKFNCRCNACFVVGA